MLQAGVLARYLHTPATEFMLLPVRELLQWGSTALQIAEMEAKKDD